MQVRKRTGELEDVSMDKILKRIEQQMHGLNRKFVEPIDVAKKVIDGLAEGISTKDLDGLAVETAAMLTATHPDYSILASRIAISSLYKETDNSFSRTVDYICHNTKRLDPKFCEIVKKNRTKIDSKIDHKRDSIFDYFGFKTLEKSYLIKVDSKIMERPQYMWMRVAIGIWGNNLEEAFKTYDLMSKGYFTHATPTLFNAGTTRPQLSSCFLLANKGDSLEGIMETMSDVAKISALAGGIGIHIHEIRADGSHIYKSGGTSRGILPLLRTHNELARYFDQCFSEETLIEVEGGQKQIKDITPGIDKVKVSSGEFRDVKVNKKNKFTGKVYEINNIKVTESHPVLIIKQRSDLNDSTLLKLLKENIIEPIWVDAKDIEVNDIVISIK